MSASVALDTAAARARGTLELYRDDGPLARLLGATLGRALALPPALGALAAALPLVLAIAFEGDGASDGLAGAVVAWALLAAGATSARPHDGRFAWSVPPLLRVVEYGGVLWIATLAGGSAPAGAFALLAAAAFRHYDLVYRLRHQAATPPGWVGTAGLGWEGRLALSFALLLAGALPAGLFIAAGLLGAVFVSESVASWMRFSAGTRTVDYEEEEEDEDQ
jgi:hypothetical protein